MIASLENVSEERFLKPLQIPPPKITIVNSGVSVFRRLHNIPPSVCAGLSFDQLPVGGLANAKLPLL